MLRAPAVGVATIPSDSTNSSARREIDASRPATDYAGTDRIPTRSSHLAAVDENAALARVRPSVCLSRRAYTPSDSPGSSTENAAGGEMYRTCLMQADGLSGVFPHRGPAVADSQLFCRYHRSADEGTAACTSEAASLTSHWNNYEQIRIQPACCSERQRTLSSCRYDADAEHIRPAGCRPSFWRCSDSPPPNCQLMLPCFRAPLDRSTARSYPPALHCWPDSMDSWLNQS